MGKFSIIPPISIKGKFKVKLESPILQEIRVDADAVTLSLDPSAAKSVGLTPEIEFIIWDKDHIHDLNFSEQLSTLFPRLSQTDVLENIAIATDTQVLSHIGDVQSAYLDIFTTKLLPFALYTQSGKTTTRVFALREIQEGFTKVLANLTEDSLEGTLEQTIASFRENVLNPAMNELDAVSKESELTQMSRSTELFPKVQRSLKSTEQILQIIESKMKQVEEREWAYFSITMPLLRSLRLQKQLSPQFCQVRTQPNRVELKINKMIQVNANDIANSILVLIR